MRDAVPAPWPPVLQHHRNGPFANLFTGIDVGKGSRPFYSGGAEGRGANTGRATTFWNVRASAPPHPLQLPPCGRDYGALVNFVGSFRGGKVRWQCRDWAASVSAALSRATPQHPERSGSDQQKKHFSSFPYFRWGCKWDGVQGSCSG